MYNHYLVYIIPLFLFSLFTSCSTATSSRNAYVAAYQHGDLRTSESILNKTIEREMPTGSYKESSDATWLLLDRATTRFASGDVEGAIADYNSAVEAFDFYQEDVLGEVAGKLLLQDEIGAYQGEDFEHILARFYLALALIQKGDKNNAYAILRQAEELQQKKREEYAASPITCSYQLIDNAAVKYLFAALLEKGGDTSNARILYREADILANIPESHPSNNCGTLLVFCHNGNVPYKISTISDASMASTVALEILLACNDIDPAISCLSGIPTQALVFLPSGAPRPVYPAIDSCPVPLFPIYDIGQAAEQQLQQKKPFIVARGVARYLLRRSATAYVGKQDPGLGAFCDFAMFIANINTNADTRSWLTLPAIIELGRYDLTPGVHTLSVQAGRHNETYSFAIKAGELCVINIFNIHPGVTSVLIPQQFLKENNYEN